MKRSRTHFINFLIIAGLSATTACNEQPAQQAENKPDTMSKTASITEKKYGTLDGRDVMQYTITNASGMVVKVINYGGTITNIFVPDSSGKMGDVALGFDSMEGYLSKGNPYFGCIVGRYANRINKGKFTLDGKTYQLPINNNGNTLHGGIDGFNKKFWEAEKLAGDTSIRFTYTSKDGEEGFPGNCAVEVTYTLSANNELKLDYEATTDKATPVNITNHSYFNLSAGRDSTVLSHQVFINADKYVAVNNELIPTGELVPVKGTSMDFNVPAPIGAEIANVAGGYDHTYVLNKKHGGEPELAVTVRDPGSGRYMEVYTTEPGVQFYSGNFLDGTVVGKNGMKYVKHGGLALEAQHFPDSPNQPNFPNTILRPGETFKQTTIYRFSVKE